MIPLNYKLRKCTAGNKLHESQEKNSHSNVHERHQTSKSEKELKTLIKAVRIYNDDIGIEFSIEKCALQILGNGKRQMTKGIELLNPK